MASATLMSRRLRLAPLTLPDVETFASERSEIEGGRVSDAAARWLAACANLDPHLGGAWSVRRRLTNRPLGCLMFLVRSDYELPEVSFMMLPLFRRRGYAHEALQIALLHLEAELGFSAVLAEVALQNGPCIGLLRKAGFVEVPSDGLLTVGFDRQPASLWCRIDGMARLLELKKRQMPELTASS